VGERSGLLCKGKGDEGLRGHLVAGISSAPGQATKMALVLAIPLTTAILTLAVVASPALAADSR
jgi:F0F1-type ATP synthase membrane subunit c/vacuolar-type H+-ATPase subunit K